MSMETGIKAENYFIARLNELGIKSYCIDLWYDFEVCNQKVEVKSATLSVKNHKDRPWYRGGRFDFTSIENRELQYKENVWICLILRHRQEYMILGFLKARQLKMKRYLYLAQLRRHKILSLEEWLSLVNR